MIIKKKRKKNVCFFTHTFVKLKLGTNFLNSIMYAGIHT